MGAGFLPAQPVLLRRLAHAVAQPLGVVAGQQQLHGGEERADELLPLAVEILADAFGHRPRGALQFQHPQGDAVDVKHEVGPLGVLAGDRHFFGDTEVVGGGVGPVDQPYGDGVLADLRPHLHAVPQQAVDLAVGVVERLAAAERGRLAQREQRPVDHPAAVPLALQPIAEQRPFNVGVVGTVLPVAKIGVTERVAEQLDHAQLRAEFPFTDRAHGAPLPCLEKDMIRRIFS